MRTDKLIITSTNKISMTMATHIKDVTAIQTEKKANEMRIHREKTNKDKFLCETAVKIEDLRAGTLESKLSHQQRTVQTSGQILLR